MLPRSDEMKPPSNIPRLVVGEATVLESERLLHRWRRLETVIYWVGHSTNDVALVTSVIRPNQKCTSGSFEISREDNANVTAFLSDQKLKLLAQLHSHPGTLVGHSYGDDLGAPFVFRGFYSIVVPLYARRGILPISQCGIHVYADGFFQFSPKDIAAFIQIIPNAIDQLKHRT
jgi:hypothetical protein